MEKEKHTFGDFQRNKTNRRTSWCSAFKSLTPVPPSRKEGAILKSDFLKRKYLIFPTIFCGLLIKYKPIILNANAVPPFPLPERKGQSSKVTF